MFILKKMFQFTAEFVTYRVIKFPKARYVP